MAEVHFLHLACRASGSFPNNDRLELCIYRKVFPVLPKDLADVFEERFRDNGWPPAWRNGLYDVHHFHSTAHEALGVYSGWVEACFGGPGGVVHRAEAGDVIVIPAGVSHRNVGQSADFRVVGAYPEGQRWNMRYGGEEEKVQAEREIALVPLPARDPLFGPDGPLRKIWSIG